MQYENDMLIDAAKEYIQLMKDSGLGYFRIKNDKFEIELGEKHPHFAPPMPPMMPQPDQQSVQKTPEAGKEKPGNVVASPIVGTFYAAPSPEKPPYVTVGKQVHKGDVLFIIESMKLMNEVTSEYDGTVAEIMVSDGETVEFGEPIMRIE
jgi:acetyl-CoA carboxylase biotin carboxyl carrier protein